MQEEPSEERLMTIAELARRTGLTTRAIRYYEQVQVLRPPPRTAGGTRRYPREYVYFLEGLLVLKDLGFSLEEIRIISLLVQGEPLADEDRKQAEETVAALIETLDHKMRVLRFVNDIFRSRLKQPVAPDAFARLARGKG